MSIFPALEAKKQELKRALEDLGSPASWRRDDVERIQRLNSEIDELRGLKSRACGVEYGDGARLDVGHSYSGKLGGGSSITAAGVRDWAESTAKAMTKRADEFGTKALAAGSFDAPGMVRTGVFTTPTNPSRLLDLVIDRRQVPSNEFEYLRQTVRTDAAAAVADNAVKPTSTFTVTSIQDRVRVYAHLSEAVPQRIFADHREIERFLSDEMARGVLDALEADIVSGATGGENVVGILETSGIGSTAFSVSVPQTLRNARTAMEAAHEQPTAWVLHPDDAEVLDLLSTADGEYIVDSSGYANIFGNIPKVITTSVPSGTALLGDFRQATLYVRQDITLDVDNSGDLFKKNQLIMRGEGRFGWAVNRPAAFREIDLTA
ncbi:phage major capsid protein [Streptomyces sp. UG1]|uniref:phage major capsid protein n=1 Tax=Streptomyces sp. UG1 TaxID=3417652 RepID=UPI003CE673D9